MVDEGALYRELHEMWHADASRHDRVQVAYKSLLEMFPAGARPWQRWWARFSAGLVVTAASRKAQCVYARCST